ncbi:MAG TPA: hypothetical protein VGO88_09140, partial [Mycetocola sp.]|nr:hypothetical protein [Mycetocola sp.]
RPAEHPVGDGQLPGPPKLAVLISPSNSRMAANALRAARRFRRMKKVAVSVYGTARTVRTQARGGITMIRRDGAHAEDQAEHTRGDDALGFSSP